MTQDTFEKIRAIISDKFGLNESDIKMESNFSRDLGADSLDVVELILEFENQFDVKITDGDAEKIKTVGDAVDYMEKALSSK